MRRSASSGFSLSSAGGSSLPMPGGASALSPGFLPVRVTPRLLALSFLSLLFVFLCVNGLPSSVSVVTRPASSDDATWSPAAAGGAGEAGGDAGAEAEASVAGARSPARTLAQKDDEKLYVLLVDAGSSGSRIHVHAYSWGEDLAHDEADETVKNHHEHMVPIIEPTINLKQKPGLSSFAKNPQNAGASLANLIKFAKDTIPMSAWARTPIRVQATAGLRSITPEQAEAVLTNVREYLSDTANSPFLFEPRWAEIISGAQEGINGWLATNYLLGVFGPSEQLITGNDGAASEEGASSSPADTAPVSESESSGEEVGAPDSDPPSFGVVEMGGASIQLTFEPHAATLRKMDSKRIDHSKLIDVHVAGKHYKVYTHSYLNYGLESVQELFQHYPSIVDSVDEAGNPCYPAGFRHSSAGNWTRCYDMLEAVVKRDQGDGCKHASCSFNGVFQPLISTERFYAIENFFYTSDFFRVATLKDFLSGLKQHGREFCSKSWSELVAEYAPPVDPKKPPPSKTINAVNLGDLAKYCFASAYVARVLEAGMGLDSMKHEVRIAKEIRKQGIDWALGAVLYSLITPADAKPLGTAGTVETPPAPPATTSVPVCTPLQLYTPQPSDSSTSFIWASIIAVPVLISYVIYKRVACVPRGTTGGGGVSRA